MLHKPNWFLLAEWQFQLSLKEIISFSCQCYKPFFSIIDILAKYIKAFVNIFSWVLYWNVLQMNDINSSADECIRNKIDFRLTKWQFQFLLKEIISFSCQFYKPFFCIIDTLAQYTIAFVNIHTLVLNEMIYKWMQLSHLKMNSINTNLIFRIAKLQILFLTMEIISFTCPTFKTFFCTIDAWEKYIKPFVNIFSWVIYWNALQMNDINSSADECVKTKLIFC